VKSAAEKREAEADKVTGIEMVTFNDVPPPTPGK
jgi:hypothetical protein